MRRSPRLLLGIERRLKEVCSTFDSTLEAVDAAEESVRVFARGAGFGEQDVYFMGLAAREILINAVVHGNGFDVNKKVTLRLCWELGCLSVEVLDEGDGFRLEAVPDPRLQENRERWSGRGVAIARQIMDEFHVEKNLPRGACVRMVKRLKV